MQGLSHQAREARSWPFEQARGLLARILRVRLESDAERDLAATLIGAGKFSEALASLPALARPVVLQCGYGASGLPQRHSVAWRNGIHVGNGFADFCQACLGT